MKENKLKEDKLPIKKIPTKNLSTEEERIKQFILRAQQQHKTYIKFVMTDRLKKLTIKAAKIEQKPLDRDALMRFMQ